MKIALSAGLVLALSLSACATSLVEHRACPAGDSYVQGYKDAANGLFASQFEQDAQACAAHGVALDAAAYTAGRTRAMQEICPKQNAPEGSGCRNSMPMIDPISADSKLIDQRYAVDKAYAEVTRLQAAIDASQPEQRAALSIQMRDAQLRHWWARETLDRMEWLVRRPGIAF